MTNIIELADAYAQACVDLECENLEHGTVDGSSVNNVDNLRTALIEAINNHRASVIEECAKVCEQFTHYGEASGITCVKALRGMK